MISDRFNELLPWYVNGTLNAADRAWVDQYLQDHPEALQQLRWNASMREQLHKDIRKDIRDVPEDIGLAKAMARIHSAKQPQPQPQPQPPTLVERVREWFVGIGMRPALAAAFVIVAAQSVVIGSLLSLPENTEIRALRPAASPPEAFIRVNFKPDAREADIRLLLVGVNGSIASGPGQLGDYYVRVAPGQREQALEQLKASPNVESANNVDGLPGRD